MFSYFLVSVGLNALMEHRKNFDKLSNEGICYYVWKNVVKSLSQLATAGGFIYDKRVEELEKYLESLDYSLFPKWDKFSGRKHYPLPNVLPCLEKDNNPHAICYDKIEDRERVGWFIPPELREKYVANRRELLNFLIDEYQELLVEIASEVYLCPSIFK